MVLVTESATLGFGEWFFSPQNYIHQDFMKVNAYKDISLVMLLSIIFEITEVML